MTAKGEVLLEVARGNRLVGKPGKVQPVKLRLFQSRVPCQEDYLQQNISLFLQWRPSLAP